MIAMIQSRKNIDETRIPSELQELPHWVCWRRQIRDGKPTKVPYQAGNARENAKTDDPTTWAPFKRALNRYRNEALDPVDGIGFVFSENDPYCGIDLDDCRDPETGKLKPWAERIVDMLRTYTEISPSQTGLKLFAKASLPIRGRKVKINSDGKRWLKNSDIPIDGEIELYDQKRFFTVTSQHLEGTPLSVEDRAEEVAALLNELFPVSDDPSQCTSFSESYSNLNISDEEIITKGLGSKYGAEFEKLWIGTITVEDFPNDEGTEIDDSAADWALCRMLAWYVGNDPERIDRLYRQSKIYRDKWERQDYRDRTIQRAIESHKGKFYDPLFFAKDESGELKPNEAADDPHRLGRLYLDDHRNDGILQIVMHRDEFYKWRGGSYSIVPGDEIRGEIVTRTKAEFDRLNIEELKAYDPAKDEDGSGPPKCRKISRNLVSNIIDTVTSEIIIPRSEEQPIWRGPEPFAFPLSECIVCPNGIIHLPSFVAGKNDYLTPPTPFLFTTSCLGAPFVADAEPPEQWLKFLSILWPDDPESILTLQEFTGYFLTGDTSLQKILFLIGPKRAGKGTIARIIIALLNAANVAGPTLSSLATNFGLWPLLNKRLAIVSDARLSGRIDTAIITERLLSISGEDSLTVDRKNLAPVTARLQARLMLLSNELPRITDASGALASRLIVLTLRESFYGREDRKLEEKLLEELPGILRWAIDGWERLQERGYFVQPESSRQAIQDLEDLGSPISAFLRDRCIVEAGRSVPKQELYDEWRNWCLKQGKEDTGDNARFGRDLLAAVPGVKVTQPRISGGARHRVYQGIGLAPIDLDLDEYGEGNPQEVELWHR